ncbi:hypothetical protein ACFLS7_02160 [Bacteroidota bacterium]
MKCSEIIGRKFSLETYLEKWAILTGVFLVVFQLSSYSQGSWNPPGADLTFPRTLLDTNQIETIRNTLSEPQIYSIYEQVWTHANSAIPTGNTTDGDRFTRSTIAKEAAFVALLNRKPSSGSIVPLTAPERDQLTEKSRQLLEEINTAVGFQTGWVFYQEWQHRSKELINYLIAYDLLMGQQLAVGSLQLARDSLISFTGHLYNRAMATYTVLIWQFKFFEFQFNNHSIMTASALGLAAVVMNDHESSDPDYQPQNWADAGLWNLDNTLFRENGVYPRVSEPDTIAGYAEGPAYFEYAFENAFPFIRAFWNFLPDGNYSMTFNSMTREIRNPWYDPNYSHLYEWMNLIRMPDGSCPAIHDSPIGFGTSITALSGESRFNIPNPGHPPTDVMWRTQYISTNVEEGAWSDTLFRALPEAGSLIFRSSHEADATFMHFIGKHGIPLSGAKAHHQGDATSFSLMANGELLAVDPGYPGAPESFAVNNASNHSLILVNGAGPLPPVGEAVSVTTNTCWIEHFFDTQNLDYGEISTTYFNVDIVRKNLFVRDRYFVLSDEITSPDTNTYTFQLQGNGLTGGSPGTPEGAFTPDFINHQGIYSRDSTQLIVHTVASNGVSNYSNALDSLATGTGAYRYYSKMLARKDNVQNTGFLSVLFPYSENPPEITTLDAGSGVNAIRIEDGNLTDLTFAQQDSAMVNLPPSVSGWPEQVKGNGTLNLVEYNPFNPQRFFLGNGDTIHGAAQYYILCNHRMDVAYNLESGDYHSGYISDSGWVGLYTANPQYMAPSSGNFTEYYPDYDNLLLWVHFASASNFTLEIVEGGTEPVVDYTSNLVIRNLGNGRYELVAARDGTEEGILEVYQASGKKVIKRTIHIHQGTNIYPIDLADHAPGLYIATLKTASNQERVKLIHYE